MWMDDVATIKWINSILKPYIEMAQKNIVLLLVLDSYQCHIMASMVDAIQQLSIEVEHIPCVCSSLC